MQSISPKKLASIIEGTIFNPHNECSNLISSITTDSRMFFKDANTIFFALVGVVNNGHNYISELKKKGMRFFVVSEKNAITKDATFILVEDTTTALQKLAAFNRQQFNYPVIGITGSNGKTIVKEWLHDILCDEHSIVRSPKSYNSQVGVPLSVLLMDEHYNLAIFEAGISQTKEMEKLAKIIAPEIGIFTTIGDAHQRNFQSFAEKIDEKLNLFANCKQLIFCSDHKTLSKRAKLFCQKQDIEAISWSSKDSNSILQFSYKINEESTTINLKTKNKYSKLSIPFTDDSSIENVCHCIATLFALNKDIEQFTAKFEQLQAIAMRLEIKEGINNCLLINDYYNSDLNSLSIALSVLTQQAAKKHLNKQIILSDIQQSGMQKVELYKKVDKLLNQWGINKIIGIGSNICSCRDVFSMKAELYPTCDDFKLHFSRNNFNSSAILIKGARQFKLEAISSLLQQKAHQTVLEINMNAIVHNLNVFRTFLKPSTKIIAMVKAFSYGSGDIEVAQLLQYQNIDYLAVAVADEGVHLRKSGIMTPIIVMNPEQDSFQNILDYHLEPNIYSYKLLRSFCKTAMGNGLKNYPIHLKIDTGMNRLGLKTNKEIEMLTDFLITRKTLKIQSIFSHLAGSDDPSLDVFTHQQFNRFDFCYNLISKNLNYPIERHILNTAGAERFPEKQFDMVRLGIGLYGISATTLPLENTGTLKSTISQIKTLNANETVGYGCKGKLKCASKIAIVPLGYADGLNRKLGNNNGGAFVNGKYAPIVGNICMDMLMLDVTKIQATTGDVAEFFGENISIKELAKKIDTIPYEILTGISQRVKRVYTQE